MIKYINNILQFLTSFRMNWMSPSDGEGLCVTSVGESVVPAMVEP